MVRCKVLRDIAQGTVALETFDTDSRLCLAHR